MATIHKLSADVINRIAAGEVVQRPSAALKELLENAIDADCSRVQVLAGDGGLEVLQVSDDGSGIHKEDLPLLCERYATSKLHSFEDLHHVTSFGFRGEALASISYVSRVTVTTRRRPPAPSAASPTSSSTAQVAWRAQYLNGSLTADPQPCAGNPGTTIRAEKLFYNTLVRRNSLRASEEWGRIVDVVSRYALAYPKIGFTCQRDTSYGGAGGGSGIGSGGGGASGSSSGVSGGGGGVNFPPNSTTRQNIRLSHGSHVVTHLRLVYAYEVGNWSANAADNEDDGTSCAKREREGEESGATGTSSLDGTHHSAAQEARVFAQMERRAHHVRSTTGPAGEGLFTLIGYTSDPTLAQRKPYLCLFINQRLVESSAVRKAIDSVYSGVLTGGHRPFTVLFLTVPTDRLDVNVHPTKKEVFLLDEELVVSRVAEVCRGAVLEAAAARQMDMLKMRHTTALALKQLPAADGGAGDGKDVSGSSSQHILEKLRDQHRRGVPVASPLTSSSAAAAAASAPATGGGPAVVVAPCTMVRVEPQKGALDRYFSQRLAASGGGDGNNGGGVRAAAGGNGVGVAGNGDIGMSSKFPPAATHGATASKASHVCIDADGDAEVAGGDQEAPTELPPLEQQRPSSAAAAYEAPSWDAMMASLQRSTENTCHESADASAAKRDEANVDGGQSFGAVHDDARTGKGGDLDRESDRGGAVPPPPASAEAVHHDKVKEVTRVKRERDTESGRLFQRYPPESSDEAEGMEDEDEEDRMREFKRHRQDVYDRVEALHSAGPAATVAVKKEAVEAEVKPDGGINALTQPAPPFPTAAHSSDDGVADAVEEAEQKRMVRLGAVVQAADLLCDEAAEAARQASTFAHVVSSSEEENEDEERNSTHRKESGLVAVAEVEAPGLLSSVSMVVERLLASTSPSAASLMSQLTYVGTIDADAFLAQVGTTLVWCDTMRLVRHVVFQRIFLRWGQPSLPAPPVLEFEVPLRLADLLAAALAFDAPHLQPHTPALLTVMEECDRDRLGAPGAGSQEARRGRCGLTAEAVQRMGGMSARAWRQLLFKSEKGEALSGVADAADGTETARQETLTLPQPRPATHRYLRRLVRRLCRWRGLLKEYFFLDITSDGLLLGLPYGLNRHWPPLLRALPLTLWKLAEAVLYPTLLPASADTQYSVYHAVQPSKMTESEEMPTPASIEATPVPTQSAVEAEAEGVAQEVACFTAVARHLADTLYGLHAPPMPPSSTSSARQVPSPVPSAPPSTNASPRPSGDPQQPRNSESSLSDTSEESWREELVQHGLFPCLKNAQLFRLPDECLRDGTIQSMVSVESLYKVFERC